jgi:hypothetical protein
MHFNLNHGLFEYVLKYPFDIIRLKDCVDLLESMGQKRLLDMNKVLTFFFNIIIFFYNFLRTIGIY